MDLHNPVVSLCVQGTQAEYRKEMGVACILYHRAWEAARNNFEACVAAHYLARCCEDPHERLRWNQVSLERANASADERVQVFYPSLYVNLGQSYEQVGQPEEARRYYGLAAEHGLIHKENTNETG